MWVVKELGRGQDSQNGSGPEVLTYVGPNDVRLTAMILAAIKAGYAVPKNQKILYLLPPLGKSASNASIVVPHLSSQQPGCPSVALERPELPNCHYDGPKATSGRAYP